MSLLIWIVFLPLIASLVVGFLPKREKRAQTESPSSHSEAQLDLAPPLHVKKGGDRAYQKRARAAAWICCSAVIVSALLAVINFALFALDGNDSREGTLELLRLGEP